MHGKQSMISTKVTKHNKTNYKRIGRDNKINGQLKNQHIKKHKTNSKNKIQQELYNKHLEEKKLIKQLQLKEKDKRH